MDELERLKALTITQQFRINSLELENEILKDKNKILFKYFLDESNKFMLSIRKPEQFVKAVYLLVDAGYCKEKTKYGVFNWKGSKVSLKYFADKVNEKGILDTDIWKFFQFFFIHNMTVFDNLRTTKTKGKKANNKPKWKVSVKDRTTIDRITADL